MFKKGKQPKFVNFWCGIELPCIFIVRYIIGNLPRQFLGLKHKAHQVQFHKINNILRGAE